jgi:hypothetical protein
VHAFSGAAPYTLDPCTFAGHTPSNEAHPGRVFAMAAASPTKSPTKEPKKKSLSVAVGDRVKVDGYESVGTVRYAGPHKVTVHTPACCVLCAIHQRADDLAPSDTCKHP